MIGWRGVRGELDCRRDARGMLDPLSAAGGLDRRRTATVPGWLARWRPDPQSAGAAGSRSPVVRVWSAGNWGPPNCALMGWWEEEDGGCGHQWGRR
ncbi:hypothetical protein V499_09625 [Pseudogymnoascus sp. VKM F-103]|nr:hypothetical protein V499_09625 [Pseudogymnoascus sp. VKM F-103]